MTNIVGNIAFYSISLGVLGGVFCLIAGMVERKINAGVTADSVKSCLVDAAITTLTFGLALAAAEVLKDQVSIIAEYDVIAKVATVVIAAILGVVALIAK